MTAAIQECYRLDKTFELAMTTREKWINGAGRSAVQTNRGHCQRILGADFDIREIRPSTFTMLANQLMAEGKKAATANRIMACLHTALVEAHLEELIDHVPTYRRKPEPKPRKEFYSPTELKLLLESALTMPLDAELLHRTIKFFYLTGCRKGELLKLRWEGYDKDGDFYKCVDFENEEITFLDVKTGGNHTIAMHPDLKEMLLEMYHERLSNDEVFEWRGPDALNRRMKHLCKKCGVGIIEGKSSRFIHAIRHTTATHLVEANVPIKNIQGLLNHADPKTTNGYAKNTDKSIAFAISNLGLES